MPSSCNTYFDVSPGGPDRCRPEGEVAGVQRSQGQPTELGEETDVSLIPTHKMYIGTFKI